MRCSRRHFRSDAGICHLWRRAVHREEGQLDDFQWIVTFPASEFRPPTLSTAKASPAADSAFAIASARKSWAMREISRGYRSGAFNGGAVAFPGDLNIAKPEFLDALEVGLKTTFLDRRLQLNTAAFYYDFTDQQFINSISVTETQLVNAGSSEIFGVDIGD